MATSTLPCSHAGTWYALWLYDAIKLNLRVIWGLLVSFLANMSRSQGKGEKGDGVRRRDWCNIFWQVLIASWYLLLPSVLLLLRHLRGKGTKMCYIKKEKGRGRDTDYCGVVRWQLNTSETRFRVKPLASVRRGMFWKQRMSKTDQQRVRWCASCHRACHDPGTCGYCYDIV